MTQTTATPTTLPATPVPATLPRALPSMRRMDFRPFVRHLAAHLGYTQDFAESRDTIWAFLWDGSECKQMLVWRSA